MRSLNLDQLRSLETVVALASFTGAARQLNLSQSAVSVQIRELEERLGVRLVERLGKKAYATAAGREVIEHARRISAETDALETAMRRQRDGWIGRVHIGSTLTGIDVSAPAGAQDAAHHTSRHRSAHDQFADEPDGGSRGVQRDGYRTRHAAGRRQPACDQAIARRTDGGDLAGCDAQRSERDHPGLCRHAIPGAGNRRGQRSRRCAGCRPTVRACRKRRRASARSRRSKSSSAPRSAWRSCRRCRSLARAMTLSSGHSIRR